MSLALGKLQAYGPVMLIKVVNYFEKNNES